MASQSRPHHDGAHHTLAWLALMLAVPWTSACGPAGHPDASVSDADEPSSSPLATQGAEGLITSETGTPLAGAFLQLKPLDAVAPAMPDIAVVSGDDGRFQYALPVGHYEITVVLDGFEPATKRVTVQPGRVVTLDFALQPSGRQP